MRYISTRNADLDFTAAQAITQGLSREGGLLTPAQLPALSVAELEKLSNMTYQQRAVYVMGLFLNDFTADELAGFADAAYGPAKFDTPAVAPVYTVDEKTNCLELWHGPTCAFKDMALQIMPRLLSRALTMTGESRLAHILVATSGDTGKAALEGYRDVPGIKISVFYPDEGVSPMQKRQMITQEGSNVFVTAVKGNFDDAQNGVKKIFADKALAEKAQENGMFFSSANSINWGRLAPQIVYYVSAYCDLVSQNEIFMGDVVNVCVPTGNFGNIFAAYIAKQMGLPLGKLICASNSNCVLTDFFNDGEYDRKRTFYKTMSPSMDILISSNLERLLYAIGGSEFTAERMASLAGEGSYKIPYKIQEELSESFAGDCLSETETGELIRRIFEEKGYLADPHTAVGIGCAEKYIEESGDSRKIILASTASPYKFAADVCRSLDIEPASDEPMDIISSLENATDTKAPAQLTATLTKEVRFDGVIDPADMPGVAV